MQEMPTEWEQDVVRAYVNDRQRFRPNTSLKSAVIAVLVFMAATGVITWLVHCVLTTVGIFAYLPSRVKDFYNLHTFSSIIILCAIIIFLELFFCFKYAVIGMVKLYQHYAPEEVRRRCLLMPTCSEYAIMAVRKYGGIVGLYKTWFRLFYRCQGNIYSIDYP